MDWKEIFPPANFLINLETTDEEDISDNDSGIASRYDCCTPVHTDITLPLTLEDFNSYQSDALSNASNCSPKTEDEQKQYAISLYYQHCLSVVNRASDLLQCDDHTVKLESAIYLFELSRDNDNCCIIARSSSVLPAIVKASNSQHPNQLELTHCCAGLIHYISQTREGLLSIANTSGCVDLVIAYLQSPFESVLFYAVTSLHNLLLQSHEAKSYIRSFPSATSSLVHLLKISSNKKFHAVCMDCLQILAYCHEETKLSITRSEGIESVFNILSKADYEKLIWTSVRLLKVLSVCEESKRAILNLGCACLDVLGGYLDMEYSPKLRLNVLWTLRNLSDVAVTTVKPSKDLLHRLILSLDEPSEAAVSCVAGILANFTCRNQENKSTLVQLGAISGILRQFSATSGACISSGTISPNFLEPALCCLRHLTAGHQLATTAALYITSDRNRLHVITSAMSQVISKQSTQLSLSCGVSTTKNSSAISSSSLSSSQWWELCRVWLGLVRNLTFFSSSLCRRDQPLSRTLADVTSMVMNEIDCREAANSVQISTIQSKSEKNSSINIYELLELCCTTLLNMEYEISTNTESTLSSMSSMTSSLFVSSLCPPIATLLSRLLSYLIKLSCHSERSCTDPLLNSLIKLLMQHSACSRAAFINSNDAMLSHRVTALTTRQCCDLGATCPVRTWSASLILDAQRYRDSLNFQEQQSSLSIVAHHNFLLTSNC